MILYQPIDNNGVNEALRELFEDSMIITFGIGSDGILLTWINKTIVIFEY